MGQDDYFGEDFLMEEDLRFMAERAGDVDPLECAWFYELLDYAGQGRGGPEGGGTRPPPESDGL